jgi:hypothetical protein
MAPFSRGLLFSDGCGMEIQFSERSANHFVHPMCREESRLNRLAEQHTALWRAIIELAPRKFLQTGDRLVQPTLRTRHGDYQWRRGQLECVAPGPCRVATGLQVAAIRDALRQDDIEVVFLSPPGFVPGSNAQVVLKVVHQGFGQGFDAESYHMGNHMGNHMGANEAHRNPTLKFEQIFPRGVCDD